MEQWTVELGTRCEESKFCFVGKDLFFIHLSEKVTLDQ